MAQSRQIMPTRVIPTGDEVDRSAARKDFFSEEKKQKTFTHWYARCGNANLLQSKVFWFFFSKKNCFLSLPAAPRQAIGTESSSKPVGIRDDSSCLGKAVRLVQRRKRFFFEKKNQKTLDFNGLALLQRVRQSSKVFASFFKKKSFLAADRSTATRAGITPRSCPGARERDAVSVLNALAQRMEETRQFPIAEEVLRASLSLNPDQPPVASHILGLRQLQCRWPVVPLDGPLTPQAFLQTAAPMVLAALSDDPRRLLAGAQRHYSNTVRVAGRAAGQYRRPSVEQQLRVGYVSSDFREHAVGFLAAELFELHNRRRVRVIAFDTAPGRVDALKARYRAAADQWVAIGELHDRDAATAVAAAEIDILIDLNGATRHARPGVFALRPARCIVNWLGFPGSLGTPHHDYIIADACIIPPGHEHFYTERVLRLPCYQPNDRQRRVSPFMPCRTEVGLPPKGTVFCAFNGTQKITPDVFAIWMQVLRAVPGSVLWLLCADPPVHRTLRARAAEAGIDACRLVFAGHLPNDLHMARYRLANLFLDTAPYGAHTTASDALWMGVPVLTCPGEGFAARVCGSLVRAAGLPECVCEDWTGYLNTAIQLGRDDTRRTAMARRLREGRDSCTLFDTPKLVGALEDLFDTMISEQVLPRAVASHLSAARAA